MSTHVGGRLAVSFFITAAFLVLFGVAFQDPSQPEAVVIAVVLAVACVGAGLYLRTGEPSSWTVGVVVAGVVVAYGVFALVTDRPYVPGTIVAGLAIVRLFGHRAAFTTAAAQPPVGYGQPPAGYGQAWVPQPAPPPFGQQQPYGTPPQQPYAQPPYPQPPYPQPPYPPAPS